MLAAAGVVIGPAALGLGAGTASAATANTVHGDAYGESVNLSVLGAVPITSGPLPEVTLPLNGSGGNLTKSAASASVPGVLSTGVLSVTTQGDPAGPSSSSSAHVANVNLGGGQLIARAVTSSCTANATSVSGTSSLATLTVGGQTVPVTPPPNTVIPLGALGSVTLNEQITGPDGKSITVNAIHVNLANNPPTGIGTGDIIIAHSVCSAHTVTGTVVPAGAIGGLGLATLLGVVFAGYQVRSSRRRSVGLAA